MTDSTARIDLKASIAAFARVAYSDLVTIVTMSLLTVLFSLPLVTVGAALLALVETLTATVVDPDGPPHERDRIRLYVRSVRENLRPGLPFSALFLATFVTTLGYLLLASAWEDGLLLLGGFIGLYAIVIVTTWLLRAATLVIRADSGFFDAMKEGAYIAFEHPSYTVLQLATAGGLLAFGIAFWIAIPLLIPGLLALLEIVSFEETAGDGALGIVSAYQG